MTEQQARSKAQQRANRTGETIYVVFDIDGWIGTKTFCTASEEELNTFFFGSEPIEAFDPQRRS